MSNTKKQLQPVRCPECGRRPSVVELKNDPYCGHAYIVKCGAHRCTNPFPFAEEAVQAWNLDRRDDPKTYYAPHHAEFAIRAGRTVLDSDIYRSRAEAERALRSIEEADEAYDITRPDNYYKIVVRAASEWVADEPQKEKTK